jgi:hypothetical protein
VLCNLAVDAMDEIHKENDGSFTFAVIDASTREGVKRLQELRPQCDRQIPVPGILVDGQIVFDRIPEVEEFTDWLQAQLNGAS